MSLQMPRLNDHYDRIAAVADLEAWAEKHEPTDDELAAIGLEPADYYAVDFEELAEMMDETR